MTDDRDTTLIEESRRIRAAGDRVMEDSAALLDASRSIGRRHAALVRRSEQFRATRPGPAPGDALP